MPTNRYSNLTDEQYSRFLEKCRNCWKPEDIQSVIEDRKNGLTYREIGEKWDRTPARIRQIFRKYSLKLVKKEHP